MVNPKLENILVISKNGKNYLITNTIKDKESGKTEKKNPMPAAVSDNGLLQLNAGAGRVDFAIDDKIGNVVSSGSIYNKAKEAVSFRRHKLCLRCQQQRCLMACYSVDVFTE